MKRTLFLVLLVALTAGCSNSGVNPLAALENLVREAGADGVITAAELEAILASLPRHDAGVDWVAVGSIGLSIIGSILGVKVLPGSILRGPWDSPKQPPQPVA